jgi:hypothetical protein
MLVGEKLADGSITPRLERAEVRRVLGLEGPKPPRTQQPAPGMQGLRQERDALKAHIADLEAARELPPLIGAEQRPEASGEAKVEPTVAEMEPQIDAAIKKLIAAVERQTH